MIDAAWFAGRLRELRETAGLSRGDLGEKAGLAGRGIEGIEQSRRSPNWDTVVALCNALGVGPEAFATKPRSTEKPKGGRPLGKGRKAAGK